MNDVEVVERLTAVIKEQAELINELFSVVQQLGAFTSLEERVKEIQEGSKLWTNK